VNSPVPAITSISPQNVPTGAFRRTLEIAIRKEALSLKGTNKITLGVAVWHGGLPIDVMPAEGSVEVQLGEENAAWTVEQ